MGKNGSGLETIHKSRYTKARVQGRSIAEIAEEEGVTEATINSSITAYELWREGNSEENVRLVQGSVVLANVEHEKEALRRALKAKRKEVIEVEGEVEKDGEMVKETVQKVVEVDDHDVQLRAVEMITQKAEVVLPKKGTSINNTTNLGLGFVQQGSGGAIGISFEDRLRKIQEKRRGLLPPAEVEQETIPEAVVVEAEPEECWIPLN